jgi:hypothetical protein
LAHDGYVDSNLAFYLTELCCAPCTLDFAA